MDDERLEWALRRLPGVLACSLDTDAVTLLLDPHASVIDIEAAANSLLLGSGDTRAPLLLGGTRPVIAGRGRFDVVPIVKAAAPGVIAIGAAALVASLVASPAAFWRDAVTPTSDAPTAISPLARHRGAPSGGQHSSDSAAPGGTTSTTSATSASDAPAAPSRRLVLLVPPLPPSLTETSAAQPASSVTVALTSPSEEGDPIVAFQFSPLVATSTLATVATAAVAVHQDGAGAIEGDKHDDKHGDKQDDEHHDKQSDKGAAGRGHGGSSRTRSHQARPGGTRPAAEQGAASAHRARHHGDDD